MMFRAHRFVTPLAGGLLVVALGAPRAAWAQESKSAPLAKELATLLDQAKLDSVAAKDTAGADQFVGALYFSGLQLLVVSARYSVPVLLNEKIGKKEYRDVYIDLNSASLPEGKVFVEDLGCNGLRPRREENQPFDSAELNGRRIAFNSDWRTQKLSEDDYMKTFGEADAQYARILTLLLAQLKGQKPAS